MADRPHIFLSYARSDANRVLPLANKLETAGYSFWIDRDGIVGGSNYATEIAQAIATCGAFVVACSADAFASRNVRQEIALAWKRDRPIVPLRLEPVEPPIEFEYWLEAAQWVDAFEVDEAKLITGFTSAMDHLGVKTTDHPAQSSAASTDFDRGRHLSLPAPLSTLVGRDDAIADISALLRAKRLVTLVGPGGIGKTSVAIASARAAEPAFADGAAFIDLSNVTDPATVPQTIALELGLLDQSEHGVLETLVANLKDSRFLLVLDNFEQVVDAAPEIGRLLQRCPGLVVLATSRIPLRIEGESVVRIEPLQIPDDSDAQELESLRGMSAVQLFVERARNVDPAFELTDENAAAIGEIVRLLDGLPLGIELAAARLRLSQPARLAERMRTSIIDLPGNRRDAPLRQHSLRETIAWSYGLLNISEQQLLRRMSVFVGGCTLDAVMDIGTIGEVPTQEVEVALESLIDSSLLRLEDGPDGSRRIAMLAPVREFVHEQLDTSGETLAVADHHASWFLALSDQADLAGSGFDHARDGARWLRLLDADLSNMRAATEHLIGRGRPGDAMRCVVNLAAIWSTRPLIHESLGYLKRLLASNGKLDIETRIRGLCSGSFMAGFQLDRDLTIAWANECRALAEASGDLSAIAESTYGLANMWEQTGDAEQALLGYEEALVFFRQTDGLRLHSSCLSDYGDKLCYFGRYHEAIAPLREGLELAAANNNPWRNVLSLNALGYWDLLTGNPIGAASRFSSAFVVADGIAIVRQALGAVAGIAAIAAIQGDKELALRTLSSVDAQRERLGVRRIGLALHADRTLACLRSELDPEQFDSLWQEGQVMPYELAKDVALAYAESVQ